MKPPLEGKVAAITGAAGGIGAATAKTLVARGASVVCADIDEQGTHNLANDLTDQGGNAIGIGVDVATREGNEKMVACAIDTYGGLDLLHANAAIQRMGRIEETSDEDWDAQFKVNLRGVALGIEAALPAFRDRTGGSVVITASLLGIVGDPELPAYGAMKGGLRALCRSLATAHGPENVRVNTICPADVDTPMLDDFFTHHPDGDAARTRFLEQYPLGRFASPEDVANVVAFLASEEASYLTGIDIPIDGGLLARIY